MAVVLWSTVSMNNSLTGMVISCLVTVLFFSFFSFWHVPDTPTCLWEWIFWSLWILEPIVKNGRPPTSHSMHSFLHQYTGSFKKPPLRRPHSVIGGSLGSFMAMPRNGSRLGNSLHCLFKFVFLVCKIMSVLILSKRHSYFNALIIRREFITFFFLVLLGKNPFKVLNISKNFRKRAIKRTHEFWTS